MNPKLFWLITAILLASTQRAEAQRPSKNSTDWLLNLAASFPPPGSTAAIPITGSKSWQSRLFKLDQSKKVLGSIRWE
jgi:hypothetical protein